MIVLLAWRNFLRQIYRFQVILGALILGFGVLVAILAVTSGMAQSLREKAARYFAGDIIVISLADDRRVPNEAGVRSVLTAIPGYQSLCRRTDYLTPDSTLFFGGSSARLRKLSGVDWSVEAGSFQTQDWVAGGAPSPDDKEGFVLSVAVADRLGIRLGDDVTITFNTLQGQVNSLSLVVRGIFQDTSLFGFAGYMDIDTINAALGHPQGTVTHLGAILNSGASIDELGAGVVRDLRRVQPTHDLITDRPSLTRLVADRPQDRPLAVTTLNANLAEITTILDALMAVTWVSSGLFLGILMIGVGNTYRMIVFERTQEIGTMRAMGAQRGRLLALLLAEAGWLGALGIGFGLLLGVILAGLFSLGDWSGSSLALMFLENGKVVPRFSLPPLLGAGLALVSATIAGAFFPALSAVLMRPVDALREGE